MTTFDDGPAKGQLLRLKRAPFFLRVVEDNGKWDALDQFEDHPKPHEKLYAYKCKEHPGVCHLHMAGGRGGWYAVATYLFVKNQPSDSDMRTEDAWHQWCEQHRAEYEQFKAKPEASR